MPSIGKFVIGNVSTLQSASNMFVNTAGYTYIHATSSNVELAFKNLDDAIEATNATVGSPLAAAADFYAALTASNTMTGNNTFSGKFTASNGMVVTNHFTADDGVITVSGKFTASNGLNLSGGELIANKNILTADSNAGATSDSIMLFDASDSDLAKTITISQLTTLVDTGGDSADFYAALTASNTFTGVNTFSGEVTASQGMLVPDDKQIFFGTDKDVSLQYQSTFGFLWVDGANIRISDDKKLAFGTGGDATIEYDEDGTDELRFAGAAAKFEQKVTLEGDLTASQGLSLSGGSLILGKARLGTDGNAGASGDSIMLFDSSDSDLAKTITISQLSSLITVEDANADFYAALTGSNAFSGTNTFSGDLTASQGLTTLGNVNVNGDVSAVNLVAQGALTASNGLSVSTQDDGGMSTALVVSSASLIASVPEIQLTATSAVVVGGATSFTSDVTVSGAITASNGLVVTSPDSAKGSVTSLDISHDGTISLGVEGLGVAIPGATTFYSDLTASGGSLVSSNNTSTVPALKIDQQGSGDAAMSFAISGDTYTMGIDNSDSDLFKLSYNSSLGSNDLLEIDNNGNIKIGSNTSAGPTGSAADNSLFISSTHKAFLHLEGDSDNSDEEGTAYIKLEQDGGAVQAIIGTIGGGNDLDPEGNAYDGTSDNNLLIGTQQNFGMQLGTNNVARINIQNGGKINLLTTKDETTSSTANLVINASSGLLARSTSDRRQKHTITPLTNSLADVCQLEPKYFYDVQDVSGSLRISGLVADDTQAVFPELVPERNLPSDVYRSIAYDRLCVYLINALKEVKERLEILEGGE